MSGALVIPFEKFGLTPEGLLRTHSSSGSLNGIDRPVVRTRSGLYLSRDFRFEVTVTIPANHDDIAYVGFGEGRPNQVINNEPTNCFLFRIHNLPDIRRIDAVVGVPGTGKVFHGAFEEFHHIADYPPGTAVRFRIERRGGTVSLSLPQVPGASISFFLRKYPALIAASRAHLFVSNTSEGTVFSDFVVRAP